MNFLHHNTENRFEPKRRLSVLHALLLIANALVILILTATLSNRDVISPWMVYTLFILLIVIAFSSFILAGLTRRPIRANEDWDCAICWRRIDRAQIDQIPRRSAHQHFAHLCRTCRELLFRETATEEHLSQVTRGVLPLFYGLTLLCSVTAAIAVVDPPVNTPREDLLTAELTVLGVRKVKRGSSRNSSYNYLLDAVYKRQEVVLNLPHHYDLRQRTDTLKQGDKVTALVDDKTIVELYLGDKPIFTYEEIRQSNFHAHVAFLIFLAVIAIGPMAWYVVRERPRARRRLKQYREQFAKLPSDVKTKLAE